MKYFLFSLALCFLYSFSFGQSFLEVAHEQAGTITTTDFNSYMQVLAHDSLEGRNTGSDGYDKACKYVVHNLKELNIQPGGIDLTYYQPVLFNSCSFKKDQYKVEFITPQDKHLAAKFGENITTYLTYLKPTSQNEYDLIFAGSGLYYPEKDLNDFSNVDVKDKIVIVEMTLPKHCKDLKGKLDRMKMIKYVEEQGAAGIILFRENSLLKNKVIEGTHASFSQPAFVLRDEEKTDEYTYPFHVKFFSLAHRDLMYSLFENEQKDLGTLMKEVDKGTFKSFQLDSKIKINTTLDIEEIKSNNIIAEIPGSDPELKNEYVVVTAHLDHVGIGEAIKKDSIYNGAFDNAAGSAAMLTVAKQFSEMPIKPKRSILFVWCTAEEKGLLGSKYFVTHPVIPKEQIFANVNLDMTGGFFETADFVPMGYDMSNLSEAVDFAANELNMAVNDTGKILHYFEQSDHFSFIQEKIPAIFLWQGETLADSGEDAYEMYMQWEHKHLHKPSDDLTQDFNNKGFENGIKLYFLVTAYAANELDKIEWNTESERYKKYILEE